MADKKDLTRDDFNDLGKAAYDVNKWIGDNIPGANEIGNAFCESLGKHMPLDAQCAGVKASYEEEHLKPEHGLPKPQETSSRALD